MNSVVDCQDVENSDDSELKAWEQTTSEQDNRFWLKIKDSHVGKNKEGFTLSTSKHLRSGLEQEVGSRS